MKKLRYRMHRIHYDNLCENSKFWNKSNTISFDFTAKKIKKRFLFSHDMVYTITHTFIDRLNYDNDIMETYHVFSITMDDFSGTTDMILHKNNLLMTPYHDVYRQTVIEKREDENIKTYAPDGHVPFIHFNKDDFSTTGLSDKEIFDRFSLLKEYILNFFDVSDRYDISAEKEDYHYSLSYANIYNKKTLNNKDSSYLTFIKEREVLNMDDPVDINIHRQNIIHRKQKLHNGIYE